MFPHTFLSTGKPTHEVTLQVLRTNQEIQNYLLHMLDNDPAQMPLLWYVNGNAVHLWVGKTTYPEVTPEAIEAARAEQRRMRVQMFKTLLSAMLIAEAPELKGAALKRLLESLPDLGNEQSDNPFDLMRAAATELLEPPVEWEEALEMSGGGEPQSEG